VENKILIGAVSAIMLLAVSVSGCPQLWTHQGVPNDILTGTTVDAYVPPQWYGLGLLPNPGGNSGPQTSVKQGQVAVVEVVINATDGTHPCGGSSVFCYIDGQVAGGHIVSQGAGGYWRVNPDIGYGCPGGVYGGAGQLFLDPDATAKLSLGSHTLKIIYNGNDPYARSQFETQFLVVAS
jgi:hypothetical protein